MSLPTLAEYTESLPPTKRKNREPGPRQLRGIAQVRRLKERLYLPMYSYGKATMIWVDDSGHEREHHIQNDDGTLQWSLWHRFEDAKGYLWAIRCPVTLEEQEKVRVRADIPEGSVWPFLREYADMRKKKDKAKGQVDEYVP